MAAVDLVSQRAVDLGLDDAFGFGLPVVARLRIAARQRGGHEQQGGGHSKIETVDGGYS